MGSSPLSASPYEVLGVATSAPDDELRRAYRRALRQTHPDTGGVAVDFHAVQAAWELVGTPDERAAWDRGHTAAAPTWAPADVAHGRGTRPAAREFGEAGGLYRERYVTLLTEALGHEPANPWSPAVVRSASPALRAVLARALAQEATGALLTDLGIGFTIWHDVLCSESLAGPTLDHLVLGPTGVVGIASHDWGAPVRVRRGDVLVAPSLTETPVADLVDQTRYLERLARVKFSALLVVVPDDASPEYLEVLGSARSATTALVQRSMLPHLLRTGFGATPLRSGAELFDLRARVGAGVRLG